MYTWLFPIVALGTRGQRSPPPTGILRSHSLLPFVKCGNRQKKERKELLDEDPYLFHIGSGLFVASFGYMLSGIVNDSLPVTAPLFWSIVGIGIAVNAIITKKCPTIPQNTFVNLVDETDAEHTQAKPVTTKKKKQSRKQRKQQS